MAPLPHLKDKKSLEEFKFLLRRRKFRCDWERSLRPGRNGQGPSRKALAPPEVAPRVSGIALLG